MNFEVFLTSIPKIKKLPLPAEASQFKMIPSYRKELFELQIKAMKNAKQSAVLALFYPDGNNQTKLALILRKSYNGVHSAQIGFPGGKVEKDDLNLEFTAIRETHEEIGVNPKYISVVKQLTQVYIPPSNFRVQPFLGITEHTPSFKLQESEVEDILEVSLIDFFNDGNVVSELVSTSYNRQIEVPAYKFNGHIVWGATAMMLSEVKDLLKEAM